MATRVRLGADTLAHRGPDAAGIWTDGAAGIAMGHRRLSIIDLSDAAGQPMVSADGRWVIAFNGEIYNFAALRSELVDAGSSLRTRSDTEALLEAMARWGVAAALQRCNGMFALAVWDRAERCLYLARDRLGQKPLYYGWAGQGLVFGSQLAALRCFHGFDSSVASQALALLLRLGAIPAPHTIHPRAWKLLPGTVMRIDTPALRARRLPEPVAYWSAEEAARAGAANPLLLSDADAIDELDARLRDAVRHCVVSDVPVGAFLSGGIDSSSVVAAMQAECATPVRTYTIGFAEAAYSEADAAAAVARHLGTDHTELLVTPADVQNVIPLLPGIYDEPFADSSQIPTYLVSRLARRDVTVCLSGDGGDELFGGYNRYTWARKLDRLSGLLPQRARRGLRNVIETVTPGAWDTMSDAAMALLPASRRQRQVGDKLHKLAEVLDAPDRAAVYGRLISQWKNAASALQDVSVPALRIDDAAAWPTLPHHEEQLMLLDALGYLPDDILVKLDRAAMAVSLEGRVPLLDHRLYEFAWRLPLSMKIRDGRSKWILREVLARYVPRNLFERPKMGFGIPLDTWLRGDLRAWAEDLLAPSALGATGLFDVAAVRSVWHTHLEGARNQQYMLWPVLMFEAWRREQAAGVQRSASDSRPSAT
ncbi:MAG: asparagine synthase (glutamine-hydrolyzing) [Alphaproteobacteria bacterium]